MRDLTTLDRLPNAPGVGYKPQHFSAIMENAAPVQWLEIHAENYMGDGGRPLARLKHLVGWLNPASFSEHLAWSTHDGAFYNDLLPLAYTKSTLNRVCDHIEQLQEVIGRKMLLENPSSYLAFAESTWSEPEFLSEISRRTGCGLLLDVNNVFVSATNLAFSPQGYIDAFNLEKVGEIHLGGHDEDADDQGRPLLIDSHGREVVDPVWALLDYTLERSGAKPVLIEWDNDVPDWSILAAEAERAAFALAHLPLRPPIAAKA